MGYLATLGISALLSLNLQEMGQGHRKWFHWRREPCPLGPRERAGIRKVRALVERVKGGEPAESSRPISYDVTSPETLPSNPWDITANPRRCRWTPRVLHSTCSLQRLHHWVQSPSAKHRLLAAYLWGQASTFLLFFSQVKSMDTTTHCDSHRKSISQDKITPKPLNTCHPAPAAHVH